MDPRQDRGPVPHLCQNISRSGTIQEDRYVFDDLRRGLDSRSNSCYAVNGNGNDNIAADMGDTYHLTPILPSAIMLTLTETVIQSLSQSDSRP